MKNLTLKEASNQYRQLLAKHLAGESCTYELLVLQPFITPVLQELGMGTSKKNAPKVIFFGVDEFSLSFPDGFISDPMDIDSTLKYSFVSEEDEMAEMAAGLRSLRE